MMNRITERTADIHRGAAKMHNRIVAAQVSEQQLFNRNSTAGYKITGNL